MSGSFTPPVLTGSITAANAVYTLTIANLYPQGVQLQGFGEDMAFETDEQEIAETKLGVDGGFAAGYVPVFFEENLSFLANSPSCAVFDNWNAAQVASGSIYQATATIYIPSVGQKISRQQGVLFRYAPYAPIHKTAQDRSFRIRWGTTTVQVL